MIIINEKITSICIVSASESNVARVNSIKKLYPQWRQESKAPTFALTGLPPHVM